MFSPQVFLCYQIHTNPHPLNSKSLPRVTKVFCQYSFMEEAKILQDLMAAEY